MVASVGIRELRDSLSAVLRRVRSGESIRVTDRGRPVAMVVPVACEDESATLRRLAAAGQVVWNGEKPQGASRPASVRGPSVAAAVIEDRR